jgi:dienelactone hydrolase
MIAKFFHRWERRLADTRRVVSVVRPFDWGLEWFGVTTNGHTPYDTLHEWVEGIMRDTDAFFTPEPTSDYEFDGRTLTFPSALVTPHPVNNVVHAQWFPAERSSSSQRAVVVLPQWNSDAQGHVGLCRLLARAGINALRLSLPYHDKRMPPELTRADYIVSANVGRTLQVCRQAVLDARLALWWLRDRGFDRLGLLGTSLGSCLAGLTGWHEPLVRAQALNHVSPFFADVVWRGLSTEHVRAGLDGNVSLDQLRSLWRPINPWSYLDRAHATKTLLVYARYDLTFPVDLSKKLVDEFARRKIPAEVAVLPCGHYTTGEAPFKFLDAYYLIRFLRRAL